MTGCVKPKRRPPEAKRDRVDEGPFSRFVNAEAGQGGAALGGALGVVETPQFAGFNETATRDFVTLVNESTGNESDQRFYHMFYIADITDVRNHDGINDDPELATAHDEGPWIMPVDNHFVDPAEGNYCEVGGRFGAHSQPWNLTPILVLGVLIGGIVISILMAILCINATQF